MLFKCSGTHQTGLTIIKDDTVLFLHRKEDQSGVTQIALADGDSRIKMDLSISNIDELIQSLTCIRENIKDGNNE